MRGCKKDFDLRWISSTLNLNPSLRHRSCRTLLSFPIYPSLTYNRTRMLRSKELHCLFFSTLIFSYFRKRLQVSLRYGFFTKQLKLEYFLFFQSIFYSGDKKDPWKLLAFRRYDVSQRTEMSGNVVPFPLTSALKPQPIRKKKIPRLLVHSTSVPFIVIPTTNKKN